MEDATWKSIAKGLAISLAYGVAYLVLRHLSFNQWFLPAGLRCGALLLVPYRYWSFLLIGDAAALLYLRVPMADKFGQLWAYGSPWLLLPLIAMVAFMWRRALPKTLDLQRWLPLVALSMAAWSAGSNMFLNYMLRGPLPYVSFENYVNYVVGDFFGILLVLLASLLWLLRRDLPRMSPHFRLHVAGAALVVALLYAAASFGTDFAESTRLLLLMLMIVPVVHLTFIGGWRGAALGLLVSSIAVAQPLATFAIPEHPDLVLVAQQALIIAACGLLFLGRVISEHYEIGLRSGIAERQAMKLARTSFLSTERVLRDQLIHMAHMQLMLERERRGLAELLKANGRHEAAMALNSDGVQQREGFDGQAMALYPIRVEENGLFKAVHEKAFSDFWAGGAEVVYGFRGPIMSIPVEMQIVTYRCICDAMSMLADCAPDEYRLGMRAWHGRRSCGLFVRLTITPAAESQGSVRARAAESLLEARVTAHGGILRRERNGASFLFMETPSHASAD